MKVLYDHQIFNIQTYGGISRLYYEIFNQLSKTQAAEYELGLKYTYNHYLGHSSLFKDQIEYKRDFSINDLFGGINFRGKGRIYNVVKKFIRDSFKENEKLMVEKLKDGNFDLFHPTYYFPYFFDVIGNKPFVVTIYDMIHELFPEFFAEDPTGQFKQQLLSKATHVIAISEHTKKDLIDIYNVPADKISVVYLASSLNSSLELKKEMAKLPKKYIMFVGSRERYKNFGVMPYVLNALRRKIPELELVCAGGGDFNGAERFIIHSLGLDKAIHNIPGDNNNLINAYKNAEAYICPSQYEGFGIPVLEAFENNCLVACSNTSSLPEVGGDAAVYFDPKNFDNIVSTIYELLTSVKLKQEKRKLAKAQFAKFSWEKTTKETLEVYKKVLNLNE